MLTRILVPYDGSKYSVKALTKAMELSHNLDSEIFLFSVVYVDYISPPGMLGLVRTKSEKESIKKLSLEEFQEKLKQIIPSTQQILQIEEKSLTDINNITDLNKILSKYFLSHKNLNIKQMTEIEQFLRNSYYNLKKNIDM